MDAGIDYSQSHLALCSAALLEDKETFVHIDGSPQGGCNPLPYIGQDDYIYVFFLGHVLGSVTGCVWHSQMTKATAIDLAEW